MVPDWPDWAAVIGTMLGLNILLHVPDLLFGTLPRPLSTSYVSNPTWLYYLFSLDLFALFCILALVPYRSSHRAGRSSLHVFVSGSILFLLIYGTYDAVVQAMLHRSPIFYADAPHLVGAGHLLLNVEMPRRHVLGLAVAVGAIVLLAWKLPALIGYLHRHLRRPFLRRGVLTAAVVPSLIVAWAVLADLGLVADPGVKRETYRAPCLSTTECASRNVQASMKVRRDLADRWTKPADSTYARYRDLRWTNPPSIYFVVIESYGSVLTAHRDMYDRFMGPIADSLETTDWHVASAHSKAPVSGGLSWLSVSTLLLGTTVKHDPTLDALRPELSRYPHLIWALEEQGYTTAALQPPVRARTGLSVRNLYGFDKTFYFRDLGYRGPEYGWGIVPDQYSLSVAHDQFVEKTSSPFFLFFEAVSSHVPWDTPPPPLVDDPGALGNRDAARAAPTDTSSLTSQPQVEKLFRHVEYDWRVLVEYLQTRASPNSLVLVVGDHQPPGIENTSFATPIHVLSRDQDLVDRFAKYGFTSDLRPAPSADTLHHAGAYSMLTRVLTAHSTSKTEASPALPPHRPEGLDHSALLPAR